MPVTGKRICQSPLNSYHQLLWLTKFREASSLSDVQQMAEFAIKAHGSGGWFKFLAVACGILAPHLGIEPRPPVFEAVSSNHWTAREVP